MLINLVVHHSVFIKISCEYKLKFLNYFIFKFSKWKRAHLSNKFSQFLNAIKNKFIFYFDDFIYFLPVKNN